MPDCLHFVLHVLHGNRGNSRTLPRGVGMPRFERCGPRAGHGYPWDSHSRTRMAQVIIVRAVASGVGGRGPACHPDLSFRNVCD